MFYESGKLTELNHRHSIIQWPFFDQKSLKISEAVNPGTHNQKKKGQRTNKTLH